MTEKEKIKKTLCTKRSLMIYTKRSLILYTQFAHPIFIQSILHRVTPVPMKEAPARPPPLAPSQGTW